MAKISITSDGSLNDDGTPKTSSNSSDTQENRVNTSSVYTGTEVVGENVDKDMVQFAPCKYNKTSCKYIDTHGNCMAENCLFDTDETAPLTNQFFTKCIICDKEFSIDPREMKAYICESCRKRLLKAEKLPFTCICCGKQQNHPSAIMFSRICDECLRFKLFNDSCKHFEKSDTSHDPS